MKNREQAYYILGAIIVLALLFFGFDTKPSTQKILEKSRVLNTPAFDIEGMRTEAKKNLPADQAQYAETLESQLRFAGSDSIKINLLMSLSGFWYQAGKPLLAGHYARLIAESQQSAESWSITGTTFASALSNPDIQADHKIIARDQAVAAFENAISLEPDSVTHRINLALSYVEVPESGQPMKGIQMLASLAEKYPDSPLPSYHLASLAMRTGQVGRAQERIEQALTIDSTDIRIVCLAADIYTEAAMPEKARRWTESCASVR